MDTVDAIGLLLKKQLEYREAALKAPRGKKGFDYGKVVGIEEGFQQAINVLTEEVERQAASEKESVED
jgi:hypothetical protein